ncbi:unnamed protein product (macronuclear) [Paramecium tetraurelia]|uniref:Uncharacterized protein n=1 Tax=Paramecium tetraurelia TaxID=5888 RepID=A0ED76_PARTE|nr:uncharacterized protein GSPATT00004112001 [Paramecium tetraurelia]CAK93243.1 unnamed protein product [Paramecium tetraurelia]|eukprot:XP_001460640.1 hypothetical protein (macronuclear) [Paramecium tetraurelia strain d4-2]
MGSLVSTNKQMQSIEQLEEDNQITANKPQAFQYYPKLYQQNYDNQINNNIDNNYPCFLFFGTTEKPDQSDDMEDSRDRGDSLETPCWNIPQRINNPDITSNSTNQKILKKSQTKQKQGSNIIQRINTERIF